MKRLKKTLKEIKAKLEIRENRFKYKNRTAIKYFELEDEFSCLCTDRNGEFKKLYKNYKEALIISQNLFDEFGLNLNIYPCPYTNGWHLSKG
jgi:translation initiation factor IF-3